MSNGLFNCYLIKKIDIWKYLCNNKPTVQNNLLNTQQEMLDLFAIEDLIKHLVREGMGENEIARHIFNGNVGIWFYLKESNNESGQSGDKNLQRFLSPVYNGFNLRIFLNVLHVQLKDYMIIQDPFRLLNELHLADLSFHTGTDGWIKPFVKAIKEFNVISHSENLSDINQAFKLVDLMESCVFDKPQQSIELFSKTRWGDNFIDEFIVRQLVRQSVKEVMKLINLD